jgi:hypothetical protein
MHEIQPLDANNAIKHGKSATATADQDQRNKERLSTNAQTYCSPEPHQAK